MYFLQRGPECVNKYPTQWKNYSNSSLQKIFVESEKKQSSLLRKAGDRPREGQLVASPGKWHGVSSRGLALFLLPSAPALSESTLQAPLIQHLCHLLCFQVFYLLSWSPSFNFTIINRLVFSRGLKLLPQSEVRSFSSFLLYLTFYSYFCLALLFYYHLHVYFRKI